MNEFVNYILKRIPAWRKDIILFAHEALNTKPDRIQTIILKSWAEHDYNALKSGHGIGKTYCVSIFTQWFMICYYNSRVVTTAPTGRQVKEVTWAEIHKNIKGTILEKFVEVQSTKLSITKNWGAIGTSSDQPENIEGFHADYLCFIIDEAKGVNQSIFDAVMGTQTTKTKIILISTPSPTPLGEFFNAFKPKSIYNTIHFTCFDSERPQMTKYIEMMKKKYGENSPIYQMKVLGNFPDISDDTLIPWQQINAAVTRNITIDYDKEFKRILACDPARFGNDLTVITIMDKQQVNEKWVKKVIKVISYGKESTAYTAGRIKELINEYRPNKVIIDCGGGDVGAGVVDQLNVMEDIAHLIEPFVAGGSQGLSDEERGLYMNWKSKAYDSLRKDFEEGVIDIQDVGDVVEQLTLLRKDFGVNGKLKILDYDDKIKSNDFTHKSPDFCFTGETKILTTKGLMRIKDVKKGMKVITPFGFRKVLNNGSRKTNELLILKLNNGIIIKTTPGHKIYTEKGFKNAINLINTDRLSINSLGELIKWRLKKLLSTKARNTGFREMVNTTTQTFIKEQERKEEQRKPYTGKYGKMRIIKEFLKDSLFITLMEIPIIMMLKILNSLNIQNIKGITFLKTLKKAKLIFKKVWRKQELKQKNGIKVQKDSNGMQNTIKIVLGMLKKLNMFASIVKKFITQPENKKRDSAVSIVDTQHLIMKKEIRVYNLTIETDNVYYANNLLVSNSDSLNIAAVELVTGEFAVLDSEGYL